MSKLQPFQTDLVASDAAWKHATEAVRSMTNLASMGAFEAAEQARVQAIAFIESSLDAMMRAYRRPM